MSRKRQGPPDGARLLVFRFDTDANADRIVRSDTLEAELKMNCSELVMVSRISASKAKSGLPSLVSKVVDNGERFIIERRGKPVAALVSIEDLGHLEKEDITHAEKPKAPEEPRGLLRAASAWGGILTNEEIDEFVADVYATRAKETDRPADFGS